VYHIVYSYRLHDEHAVFERRKIRKGDGNVQGESNVAPAKRRYDRKKPVVSFRVSREQLEKLDELIKGSGISKGRFLRRALGLEIEKKDRIYRKGRKDGYREAKEKYAAFVRCKGCGEPIPIIGGEMEIIVDYAVEQLFCVYHRDCRPPDVPEEMCQLFDREVVDE